MKKIGLLFSLFDLFSIIVIILLLLNNTRMFQYAVLAKRLKEVDAMKDDFISMTSHELKTPLTLIRGYAEYVEESKNIDFTWPLPFTSNIVAEQIIPMYNVFSANLK